MNPGEAANASKGVLQQLAGMEGTTKNGSDGSQLQQNSNEHLSSALAVAAAAATQNESQKRKPQDAAAAAAPLQFHVAPVTQQSLLAAASAGGVAPHLFFPPTQPSAITGNAHSASACLPFHSAAAAAAAPASIGMNPFALHQASVVSGAEQRFLTPPVFRNTKLRSGKWLREEEAYAELLIDLFEKGHVNDCQNGTTLRAYLSQKLHCAPMRISKKYAGRGIGKMVYLSKLTSAGVGLPFDQQKQIDIMVQTTETKFIKAASPTNEFLRSVSRVIFVCRLLLKVP